MWLHCTVLKHQTWEKNLYNEHCCCLAYFIRQRQKLQYRLKTSIAPPSGVIFFGKSRHCNRDWKLQSRHPLVLFFKTKVGTAIEAENFNRATLWCYFLRQRQILQYWLKTSIAPPSSVIFYGKGRYFSTDWKPQPRHPLVLFFPAKADTAIQTENVNRATPLCFFTATADTSILTENFNCATFLCYFFRQR